MTTELSGGEQQRTAVARAACKYTTNIIADEPTGNLDPKNSVEIIKLEKINRKGTTVIVVTHNTQIVNRMKKRVIEIDSGHIIRDTCTVSMGKRE